METKRMLIEYDEKKRQSILEERNVDLLFAARIFGNPVLTFVDTRVDYGEVREISIGLVEEECFVVVHTQRGEKTRLITAWKGGRDERSRYQDHIAGRN